MQEFCTHGSLPHESACHTQLIFLDLMNSGSPCCYVMLFLAWLTLHSSKTSAEFQEAIWHHIPEDRTLLNVYISLILNKTLFYNKSLIVVLWLFGARQQYTHSVIVIYMYMMHMRKKVRLF
jgi:hypothetical protein